MSRTKLHIVMYAANLRHWGKLNPHALLESVESPAGTEIAMMGTARALAQRGHRVTVFANCQGEVVDGVEYVDADLALTLLTTLGCDVLVSWQDATVFLHPVKAKLKVLMSQSSQLNVANAADVVDRYFGISRYSAKLLLDSDAYADPSKMWITRNGIITTRFSLHPDDSDKTLQENLHVLKTPHSMVWSSSPDRGLHHLVDIFTKVRAAVPDATLTILYNFDKTLESYRTQMPGSAYVRWLEKAKELKCTDGVTVLNHVSQPEVARILERTEIYAYPCDPIKPTETYCIAASEALAAGCAAVISDADCLPENFGDGAVVLPRPIDYNEWADTIVGLMSAPNARLKLVRRGLEVASRCDFREVALEWETLFESFLAGASSEVDYSLAARLERAGIRKEPLTV